MSQAIVTLSEAREEIVTLSEVSQAIVTLSEVSQAIVTLSEVSEANEVEAPTGHRTSARVAALRALTLRRLTEAQLWQRLARKGYADADIRDAVAACKTWGYLDDRLFAQLYVDGRRKAVGDARLIAELVRRGIDRDAARASVEAADLDQDARLATAIDSIYRKNPDLGYPNAARALERLGFPAPAIYRHLRNRAAVDFPELSDRGERFEDSRPTQA